MLIKKNRRGRPPLNHGAFDFGTPELQKKRQMVMGEYQKNLRLSESLLGILYAREWIDRSLYEAGVKYYELGYRFIPQLQLGLDQRRSVLSTVGMAKVQGPRARENDNDNRDDAHIAQQWKAVCMVLKKTGVRSMAVVTQVVFYDGDPRNQIEVFPQDLMSYDLLDLKRGLGALVQFFCDAGTKS